MKKAPNQPADARETHGGDSERPHPSTYAERLGERGGELLAPLIGLVATLRRARMFHPDGLLYAARVEPIDTAPDDLARVAERLAGPALARLSSAWWRGGKEWPDVLGIALRFGEGADARGAATPGSATQDLLLATIRFPWTTPLAPLTTRVSSFLWNHYHAVSPFAIDGVGRAKLRLRSPRLANSDGLPRAEHLARAVAAGAAVYQLEARRLDRSPLGRRWESFARVTLERRVEVDQAALRFSPFLDRRGLRPIGFVHHLRVGAYAASQRARPRRADAPPRARSSATRARRSGSWSRGSRTRRG